MEDQIADVAGLPVDVVMNTVLDGLIVINEKGLVLSFNPAAEKIFGYSATQVIGHNIKLLMPPPFCDQHDGYLAHYRETGIRKIIGIGREVIGRRKDGSTFPVDLGINETHVDGTRYFVGTIRDISDRKQAEQLRDAERNQLQAVLNTVLDGIITIDAQGTIRSFNPAAERIFGYAKGEVIGQNVSCLMPEPFQSEHNQYLRNYQNSGVKKIIGIGRQVVARHKDGREFPIDLSIGEMQLAEKTMFVGTIRDISDRVKAEAALQNYVQKLKQSNRELDDFAYIASHDLKEPLRGISNNALFLEEDYSALLDTAGKRRIERMKYLCKRLESLVDDLLYFSRLGRQDMAIREVDLNTVVQDICQLMESSLVEANVTVTITQPLPTIICDASKVTEVFRNLITNAIKYNDKDHKMVEVGVADSDKPVNENIVFFVKDNGIGIDKRFYTDVFRIFKRLNSEDDKVKGTGVGLTFVKKIIARHGGSIWLESTVGVGSTFFFTLTPGSKQDE